MNAMRNRLLGSTFLTPALDIARVNLALRAALALRRREEFEAFMRGSRADV